MKRRIVGALVPLSLLAIIGGGLAWCSLPGPGASPARTQSLPPAPTRAAAQTLRVVTWNLAWGQGRAPDNASPVAPAQLHENLARIAEALRALAGDVVLLQEVDVGSSRSHGVDMATTLAEAAAYPWWTCGMLWSKRFIPWPPTKPMGRIRSGTCVLSRHPLEEGEVHRYPPADENSFLTNLFYSQRGVQITRVGVGQHRLRVVNTHLDAYLRETREGQATRFASVILESRLPVVAGGDINTVPPEAKRRARFPDDADADFSGDETLQAIRKAGLAEALVPGRAHPDEETFTFPASAPNRRLDTLWVGSGARLLQSRVATEVGTMSDHLPVVLEVHLPSIGEAIPGGH